ncbi:aminoglycoside phosphotransferase family protein [Paenibacillus sp. CGMCC 1.16610]|uniref:Phosphotransferase n=1 Tax=Paenibacillus anseongense TaxID=2682845 RepID=A0ABW9UHS6_9BACL|nr:MULTISPECIES: aminoglycoside phosphotransferase family protein [Paenibacillus]MBA2936769.1 aminoglycoside phosphotransferase family protein [Paenibacillus sp. CGMCC 1.16610]MVQ39762.1 phosphotransferase [Paenibacillus anseongense]
MSHANDLVIDAALVKSLISTQFPQWAELPMEQVISGGTDNVIYRLGTDMAVRLPRAEWAVGQVEKEQKWLPQLAALLPIPIHAPIAFGAPTEGYPRKWSVYRWLEGENATVRQVEDQNQAANALAQFVTAMQRIDSDGGPPPGAHNSGRGEPLVKRDAAVRAAIITLHDIVDTHAATAVWEAAQQAPVWQSKPVWIHGDLHPGNLLIEDGRLSAVIDFGTLGVGDPSCDLMVAWTFLAAQGRERFRAALPIDDAAWLRGSGWALSFGLIALAYYLETNLVLAEISRRTINEVLADYKNGLL